MLPDFLKTKEKLKKMHAYFLEQSLSFHISPFNRVPTSIIFEGNKTVVVREDGSIEEGRLAENRVEIRVELADVEEMTPDEVFDRINGAAIEMAGMMKKSVYEQIEKSAEEVGNVVDAKGKPFTIGMYFEMLEKMEIDFDEAGYPMLPTCVVSPKLMPSIAKVISQAENDPEINKRFQDIIKEKREEWNVRENNRKLVG